MMKIKLNDGIMAKVQSLMNEESVGCNDINCWNLSINCRDCKFNKCIRRKVESINDNGEIIYGEPFYESE